MPDPDRRSILAECTRLVNDLFNEAGTYIYLISGEFVKKFPDCAFIFTIHQSYHTVEESDVESLIYEVLSVDPCFLMYDKMCQKVINANSIAKLTGLGVDRDIAKDFSDLRYYCELYPTLAD